MGGTTDRPNDRVSFFFSFNRKTIRKDRAWKYLLFLQRNFSEIIFYRSKIQFILELGSERRLELDQTWLDVGQSERRAYRIDRLDTFNFRPFIRNVYRKHYYRRIIKFILFVPVHEQVFQWEGRVWQIRVQKVSHFVPEDLDIGWPPIIKIEGIFRGKRSEESIKLRDLLRASTPCHCWKVGEKSAKHD